MGYHVRIIVLSSIAGAACRSIDPAKLPCPKEEYHEFAEYGVTKALDCLHAQHLQRSIGDADIVACAVHPGIIGTSLGQGNLSLRGKVAIITGASNGLGLENARCLM